MRQVIVAIDIQSSFNPPEWLIKDVNELAEKVHTIATVERHDESRTPFKRQLNWAPNKSDDPLIKAKRTFVKFGYLPPPSMIEYLAGLELDRVLVCGIQAETCVLAAGFALFDAGLQPTLIPWLSVGSTLDKSGELGARLWKHHFGKVLSAPGDL
jgi:nicotinamidase-related amidase